MLQSMTGYGKATVKNADKNFTIELRSLNSKQFDLIAKMPPLFKEKEPELRKYINKHLQRGKVELMVKIEGGEAQGASSLINSSVFNNYYRQIESLHSNLGLPLTPDAWMPVILRMPDVLQAEDNQAFDEAEWQLLLEGLDEALRRLEAFRKQEGEALEKDILGHIGQIEHLLAQIRDFETDRLEIVRDRIHQSLNDHFAEHDVDKNRFEQELIYYIEKLDITEEKVRLSNHCNYFRTSLKEAPPVGKKLAFVSQEIGREINTIGSKANHSDIQRLVIQMKDELEKIKEQLMNIL